MANQLAVEEHPVEIIDGAVHLYNFEERDPEVINFVAASDDLESAVHRVMQVGARALSLARTSIDANFVESAFGGMTREFDGKLEDTIEQMNKMTSGLLDEKSGALPQALQSFREQLSDLLGDAFDPDSKKSIIGTFEQLWADAAKVQISAVRRVVDPDDPESPLGRHRAEIVKTVKETEEKLAKAVAEISEKIAVHNAQAELIEKTASKGFAFEELLHETISRIAAANGDIAERVGGDAGAAGTKVGDEVVTLGPDDTRGIPARYVLELKDRKLGLNATLKQLDQAMVNREASVGIAVFSREENAPVPGPFQFWGKYAIVVLDKSSVEDGALRLACLWARWMVRRDLEDDGTDVDLHHVAALIEDAHRALDHISNVRRCHTVARKHIDQATAQMEEMASDLDAALDAIAEEITS
jgi:hypothetical protein